MVKNDVFELNGLTDLQKKIDFVTKSYPDESEELLTKMGNQFRREVKRKTPKRPQGITRKKLINSYRVSKVRGDGKDLYVEFRSTSPHFHLVERGIVALVLNGAKEEVCELSSIKEVDQLTQLTDNQKDL